MAGGVITRLGNLWKGFLSLWVSGIEQEHPEIVYENAINSMIEKYAELKKATAAVIRRRDDISSRLNSTKSELKQIEKDLSAALATDQKDLGMVLIEKKNQLTNQIVSLEADMTQANADAENTKSSLMQVQADINKVKAEKDQMLAKFASAKARLAIQEQLDGLSVDAEVKALDNVRTHIKNVESEAKLGEELKSTDLDEKLKKLRQSSGSVEASDEWEKMKAAKSQTNRTM